MYFYPQVDEPIASEHISSFQLRRYSMHGISPWIDVVLRNGGLENPMCQEWPCFQLETKSGSKEQTPTSKKGQTKTKQTIKTDYINYIVSKQ